MKPIGLHRDLLAGWALVAAFALTGCSLSPLDVADSQPLQAGRLPTPDVALQIPQLGPCTDAPDRTLHLNAGHPVAVMVHGCNGSAGNFRSLAQLHAFHGQQAVCFSYDGRDSLVRSSAQLAAALEALAGQMRDQTITLIGHSMGGLIARKAMERSEGDPQRRDEVRVNLVTVSAPVAGIAAAGPCGNRALHWLSLGLLPASCWMVSGDNWFEITAPSDFIRRPGPLLPSVQRYLKVVTDERGACRRRSQTGACIESDHIFGLPEQYHAVIDAYPQVTNVQVDAGHVEIVGYKDVAPRKLLAILQQQGVIAPTPLQQQAALERLLARLY